MSKQILITTCEECPYCYYDKYGYLNSESKHYCEVSNQGVPLDIKKLPDWCELSDGVAVE